MNTTNIENEIILDGGLKYKGSVFKGIPHGLG